MTTQLIDALSDLDLRILTMTDDELDSFAVQAAGGADKTVSGASVSPLVRPQRSSRAVASRRHPGSTAPVAA